MQKKITCVLKISNTNDDSQSSMQLGTTMGLKSHHITRLMETLYLDILSPPFPSRKKQNKTKNMWR